MSNKNLLPATESNSPPVQLQLNLPQRILVVDRDPYVRHLSADVLIRHGYEVNAVEAGAAGWKELQAYNYHLLITEHDLPKLTGIALVRKLRAARMGLPVVMAAGRLPTRALAQNPSLQFSAMLLKPLPVDALLDTVRIILYATRGSGKPIVAPPNSQNQSSADGGLKLTTTTASTRRVLLECNESHDAYAHWGLND
ncbi:MAG: response regulator [Verrucomicrobia bacterium]|nr:response regulator [Verrucomicrobiota bacterium]